MKEKVRTISIYDNDLLTVVEFQNRRGLKTRHDAIRVCIEYANAHGALK
jgi:hypothetical protein